MPNVKPLAEGDPHRLGAYDVTGRLGEGGQGLVYLGEGTAGQVAIKLLHTQLIEDQAARARFVREVEVTKRVARFCTAQVLDAGMAGDRPYIVSEYVAGPSLHEQLRNEGPRRGSALDRLAINTATALAAIHKAGVVHRDFKPGNVLMGPDGPVVIDFGIARALDASNTTMIGVSQVVGTPAFMAPEQLADGPIGPHTDMFAWAVTMAYAATGVPAFGHKSIPKVINRILHEDPDLGALDGDLREIVAACLAKDPTHRPNARRLMDELMGHGGATPLSPTYSANPTVSDRYPSSPSTSGPHPSSSSESSTYTSGPQVPEDGTMRLPGPVVPPGDGTMRTPAAGHGAANPMHTPGGVGPHGPTPGGGTPYGPTPGGGSPHMHPGGGIGAPPHGHGLPPAMPPGHQGPPGRRGRSGFIIAGAIVGFIALLLGLGALASSFKHKKNDAAAQPSPSKLAHRRVKHHTPTPTPSRTPSHRPTSPKPKPNPYTPQRLCGSGYRVIGVHGLGDARAYLLYNTHAGTNCVVTLVTRSTGKTFLDASLVVQGGSRGSRSGSFPYYAGPIRLPAKGKCVMWGGASKTAHWTSAWTHCGR